MALTPEDFARFKAHLDKFQFQQPCPVCGSKTWTVAGLEIGNAFTETGGIILGGQSVPKAVVVCNECGFIREFAWLRVRPELKPSESGGGGQGG